VTNTLRSAAGLVALRLAEGAAHDAWAIAAPAVATLRRAAAWARASGLVPLAVEAASACGQHDAAQRLTEDVERGLTGRDAPAATAELHLARGILLGRSPAAATCFAQAHELWAEIGRPYEAAQAAERLGSARDERDEHDAAAHLDRALAVYLRLNATYDAARCQRTMKDLGLARTPARGPRGYGVELSPREKQVAELLARGATNHEIAQALFLSPRTVELHVAHTLKKLGTARKDVNDALQALRRSS
jgi:DNA-binding CsgD family transcriptional regulator